MKKIFPSEKVIETKHFDVHQDWETPIPGFFIIASKRKIRSVADFTEEESKTFVELLVKLRKGMKKILNIDDVYLFQNEDTEHDFHLWIFPRYDWMEPFGRKIQSVRPIVNYAKEKMANEHVFKEVREAVEKMAEYMS